MTNLEKWNLNTPSTNTVTAEEIIDEVKRCKHCILCPVWKDDNICHHEKGCNPSESKQTCADAIREWATKEG